MQVIQLKQPGGLDNLTLAEIDSCEPAAGEIRVRNHASSLNFHDYAVAIGMIPVEPDRIPMSDGAGVVEAVGEGVTDFSVGDKVMSAFFPNWEDGAPDLSRLVGVPGDMVDGFAAQSVTMNARAFTHMPAAYSFQQAATLRCADRLARVDGGSQGQTWRYGAGAG